VRAWPCQHEHKPIRTVEQLGEYLDSRTCGPDLSQGGAKYQSHDLSFFDDRRRLSGACIEPTAVCNHVRTLGGQACGNSWPR
jgi:hypothetical protein